MSKVLLRADFNRVCPLGVGSRADSSAYAAYVVSSPSKWWDDRELLPGEAKFVAALRAGKSAPRILFTSSELEGAPAGHQGTRGLDFVSGP